MHTNSFQTILEVGEKHKQFKVLTHSQHETFNNPSPTYSVLG